MVDENLTHVIRIAYLLPEQHAICIIVFVQSNGHNLALPGVEDHRTPVKEPVPHHPQPVRNEDDLDSITVRRASLSKIGSSI